VEVIGGAVYTALLRGPVNEEGKMMERRWTDWLVVGVLLATTAYVVAEEISLTTWYPSPIGAYQELRVGTGEMGTPHAKLQVNQPADDGLLALRVTDEPADSTPFVIDQAGNVGIGTATPVGRLTVQGIPADDTGATLTLVSSTTDNKWTVRNENTNLALEFSPTNIPGGSPKMVVQNSGNVGIGTTSPSAKLTVQGPVGSESGAIALVDQATGNKWSIRQEALNRLDFELNGLDQMSITSAGEVGIGIGTASPEAKLDILQPGTTAAINLKNTGAGYSAVLQNYSDTRGPLYIANYGPSFTGSAILVGAVPASSSAYSFFKAQSNLGVEDTEFILRGDGEAFADGGWSANGADYAEYFENLDQGVIEKGTLVALEKGKVRVARNGDDFLAGVVSTFAGIIGNNGEIEEDKGSHPEQWTLVALMGQVPVNVRGEIAHGDSIELDDAGIGKRAERWHPEVVGRAMEDHHSEDVGKITVLIK
jgi:hypothetical protein